MITIVIQINVVVSVTKNWNMFLLLPTQTKGTRLAVKRNSEQEGKKQKNIDDSGVRMSKRVYDQTRPQIAQKIK